MKKQSYFTARHVEHFKPDPDRRIEVPAGPPSGLYLIVQPSGRKSWALRYRWCGVPTKLTFGKGYPEMGLAAARAEAEAALECLERGENPGAQIEEEPRPDTFSHVVREFVERYAKRNKSWRETERILNREPASKWGNRPMAEISRADVLRLLDGVMDRGAGFMANRTHSALRKLFNWSIERGIIQVSPVAGVGRPTTERSRDRVLSAEELLWIWKAAEVMQYPFGDYARLLLLTAQRKSEVARLRWQDLNFSPGMWTLPREATKANRIHDVPLSAPVLELLEGLPRFDGGEFVFSSTGGLKPINSFSKATARMDAEILKCRREAGQEEPLAHWRLHDLRRTAATWLASTGTLPHVLGALLNHSPGSSMGITAVYVRHRFEKERREALEKWAQHVLSLAAATGDVIAVGA